MIRAFDKAEIGSDTLIGESIVDLNNLRDQYKHEDWFDLQGPKGICKLKVNLHWIHSRAAFLKSLLDVQVEAIQD